MQHYNANNTKISQILNSHLMNTITLSGNDQAYDITDDDDKEDEVARDTTTCRDDG